VRLADDAPRETEHLITAADADPAGIVPGEQRVGHPFRWPVARTPADGVGHGAGHGVDARAHGHGHGTAGRDGNGTPTDGRLRHGYGRFGRHGRRDGRAVGSR
jgi:hypothetical protein